MKLKLKIDMVPIPCKENVRTLMGKSEWRHFRAEVLADQGKKCAICGSPDKLECHEEWGFDATAGVQRLMGFRVICKMCHLVIHFNQAEVQESMGYRGTVKRARKHFLAINGVNRRTFDDHLAEAKRVRAEKSKQKEWTMNLGVYGALDEKGRLANIGYGRRVWRYAVMPHAPTRT